MDPKDGRMKMGINQEPAVVILAAGIGSRYGADIKQLEAVGENGEIIMDYSVHDAIEAGFRKIIFIIRKSIEKSFMEVIGNRMAVLGKENGVEICYAFQELDDLPEGYHVPQGRTKPWGTGHAILCCRNLIHEPFVVINADDYYGKKVFSTMYDFLKNRCRDDHYAMMGYTLKNTLSDNGSVNRGVCTVDKNGLLMQLDEVKGIELTPDGICAGERRIDPESVVSMNMWGLPPKIVDFLEEGFLDFLKQTDTVEKEEFYLPKYIDVLIKNKMATVEVLKTQDQWFGVTYQADKQSVVDAFRQLHESGVYQSPLFQSQNVEDLREAVCV